MKEGLSSPGEFIHTFGAEAEELLENDGFDLKELTKKGFINNG